MSPAAPARPRLFSRSQERGVAVDGPVGLAPAERALFVLLVALSFASIWAFEHFPSQDGPIHLEIAGILRRLGEGAPAFERFFEVNRELEPNWFVYLPLAALFSVVPPLVAEKLLLSGYVLLFPAALLYAVRSVRRSAAWLALLGFPLLASFPLHMGFYNYCYGLALALVALGFWLRRRHRIGLGGRGSLAAMPAMPAIAALAVLLLAVGFAHPVALAFTGLAVGAVAAAEALAAPPGRRWGTLGRLALPPLAAALPALAPLVLFVGEEGARDYVRLPAAVLVRHLAALWSLVSYSRAELAVSLGLLLLLAALGFAAFGSKRGSERGPAGGPEPREPGLPAPSRPSGSGAPDRDATRDAGPGAGALAPGNEEGWPAPRGGRPLALGLGATTLLLLAVYFAAPLGVAGGGYLNQRLQIPLLLAVVLTLAGRPGTDRLRRPGGVLAALLAVAALALHARAYARLDPLLAEYRSVGLRLAPGSTLLSLSFAHRGPEVDGRPAALRIRPFQHAAGYLSAERGVIDLTDYQADRGYFPVRYRRACNPFGPLGSIEEIEEEPPRVHLGRYRRALARGGCGDVDYVLVWALAPARRDEPAVAALLAEVEAGYELVEVSRPRGLARLYRRVAQL